MAKKRNRRTSKPAASRKSSPTVAEESATAEPGKTASRPSKAAAPTRQEAAAAQLEQEYGYVVKDLRRVFLLALTMFALLIVLNLLLRLNIV